MQELANQMDQRDDQIENLEYEIEDQRRRTRELFKLSIKNGEKIRMSDVGLAE